MGKQKREHEGKIFRSEAPITISPPTLTTQPRAFVRTLSRIWGRGLSLIAGAALLGIGFFVIEGADGSAIGLLGVVMIVTALVWHRWRRP